MGKALDMVSENLHLDFSSASYTCMTWGKPRNLSVTFLPAENEGVEFCI